MVSFLEALYVFTAVAAVLAIAAWVRPGNRRAARMLTSLAVLGACAAVYIYATLTPRP